MPMTIDGNGSITGLVAGGLPDATITQPELALGVSGTGPAFSAYQSSSQSIGTGVVAKIQLQTEEFDTANAFDNVTNYRFTPQVAGYYQINGLVSIAGPGAFEFYVAIYKNGALAKLGTDISATNPYGLNVSVLISMNGTTDYLELYLYNGASASRNTASGSTATYFQGFLARTL